MVPRPIQNNRNVNENEDNVKYLIKIFRTKSRAI